MTEMTNEKPFAFDSNLGVIQLNRTALDKSKAVNYTWENGGIYTEYTYHLVNKSGGIKVIHKNLTPRIESFLRSRSFAPTKWQYWKWKVKRFLLICKRSKEIKKWMK